MICKLRYATVVVLALSIALMSCADDGPELSAEEAAAVAFVEEYDLSEPAALIGSVAIESEWMFDLVEELLEVRDPDGELTGVERAQATQNLFRQMLSAVVVKEVIASIAADNGVTLTDADVDAEVAAAQDRLGGETSFVDTLTQEGVTLTVYREILAPWELYQQRLETALRTNFEPMELREVRHILVETEAEATDVYDRIVAGEAFGDVAEDVSLDTLSGEEGGNLGPSERGRFVAGFEEVVWAAAIGELLGPVETEFGYHVAEVLNVRTYAADELDDTTRERILITELNTLMTDKMASITIVINPKVGRWDADQGMIVPF